MKKILLIAAAFVLGISMAIPSWAVENQFGGYWRTRAFSQTDIDGNDSGTLSAIDSRTRLYYTAKFNDTLKFVNKFEFDPTWGDSVAGDIGADGNVFELKNTYVDFSMGAHNFKMGIQGYKLGHSLLIDDDFSGINATFDLGSIKLPVVWARASTADLDKALDRNGINDANLNSKITGRTHDYFFITPIVNIDDNTTITPYVVFDKEGGTDTMAWFLGADVDMKIDAIKAWATLIYEGGKTQDLDNSAYLVAAGADAGLIHGQAFYVSGDDDANDGDNNEFGLSAGGQTYYWAEILGYGLFGDTTFCNNLATNAPGATDVRNVMAVNVGATVKPMDKLTLMCDLWYAQLVEDRPIGGSDETDLGVEVDLRATYKLMDNLTLDVVAAYLMAGNAIGDEDPIEVGTQLSLSF